MAPTKMIEIPAGPVRGLDLSCAGGAPTGSAGRADDRVITHDLEAFRIDERVVTCAQWEACVADGPCGEFRAPWHSCSEGIAVVVREAAALYCASRRAELPSYAQWLRATGTGPGGNDTARDCTHPTSANPRHPRCEHTSAEGVTFVTRSGNIYEWSHDRRCVWSPDRKRLRTIAYGLDIYSDRVVGIGYDGGAWGEFRCAITPLPPIDRSPRP